MKNLSNLAKSNIFLLLSVVAAVLNCFIDYWGEDTVWGLLLGFGYYYWGKDRGMREEQQKERQRAIETVNYFFTSRL